VEPKNSRFGNTLRKFQKCFRKPWGSIYSDEMFSKMIFGQENMILEDKGVGGFQMTLVITRYPPEQLTCATTLPRYGTGLSPKFVCLSAGSLALYKGL
jgi:hypothetical protein